MERLISLEKEIWKKIGKPLDKTEFFSIMIAVPNIAGLCKGSTADSDSVCEGSNPSPAAKRNA